MIGINVDAQKLSLNLPDESRSRLVDELIAWAKWKKKERVKKWLALGGWINWALNVFPQLRPALNNFYPKLTGQRDSHSGIWINNEIWKDFTWALNLLEQLDGIFLLKSLVWEAREASQIVYCDACPTGMGFWYPALSIAFFSPMLGVADPSLIFYFEALCVFSALVESTRQLQGEREQWLVIYTDNLNTVQIFSSLHALPRYNHLLKAAMDILVARNHLL